MGPTRMYVNMYVSMFKMKGCVMVCQTVSGLKCSIRRPPPRLLEAQKNTWGWVYFRWSGEIFLKNFMPYHPRINSRVLPTWETHGWYLPPSTPLPKKKGQRRRPMTGLLYYATRVKRWMAFPLLCGRQLQPSKPLDLLGSASRTSSLTN